MTIQYSGRGMTRDRKQGRCWRCGSVDVHSSDRWTPPSERQYFHPTTYVRHWCLACDPQNPVTHCALGHKNCKVCDA